MMNKKFSIKAFFLFFMFAFSQTLFAQTSYPTINKDILFHEIKQDTTEAKFFLVATFVNYCHGAYDLTPNMKMLDSITGGQTRFFICQSSHAEEDRGAALKDMIDKVGLQKAPIYLIDTKIYPAKRKDERLQGLAFRKDICSACQFSISSGVYYIVFNREGIIMYHGYSLEHQQMEAILTCNKG